MKRISKLIAVLLALVLIAATAPAVAAADTTTAAGETVTINFSLDQVAGVDGEFSFSNPGMISGTPSYTNTQTMMGSVQNNIAYFYGSTETSITISVSFTVSASAQPGDSCVVSFTYETFDVNGNAHVSIGANGELTPWKTASQTVTVAAPSTPPSTEPTTPTTPAVKIDYTELNKQIEAATALVESEYTAESWAVLAEALADAQDAKSSKDQDAVDAAAEALAKAIEGLVKLDYTALQSAIEGVESFLSGDALDGKLSELMSALSDAKALLGTARDQKSIDDAAAALSAALEDLEQYLQDLVVEETEPSEPTEPTEPAEPVGDYCNIKIHYVWPVLFFISLAVNIAFVVLAVLYIRKKKEEEAASAEKSEDAE